MKPRAMEQIIYAKDPQWAAFGPEQLRIGEPFAAVEKISRVVWCPEKETVGVVSLNGNPQFAAVLIERQLRQRGEIDGESKVLVHQVLKHRDSYSALYSALPLPQWQRFQSWLDEQPVLCIAFSWLALLHDGLADGHARIVQDGTRLLYLARQARQFIFFNVVAFSEGEEDLESAGRSLAVQLLQSATDGGAGSKGPASDAVEWLPTLDRDAGGAAQRGFEQAIGLSCRLLQQAFRDEGAGESRWSGVPLAASTLHPRHSIGPRSDRWLYTLERDARPVAGLTIAAGIALSALGASWLWEAEQQKAQALKVEASVAASPDGQAVAKVAPVRDELARQLAFQHEALRLVDGVDLHGLLGALRDAGSGRVRLLSVRLEDRPAAKAGSKPVSAASTEAREIFIEGLLPETRETGDGLLSGFVQQLNGSGWRVEPAEYRGGSSSNGSMAGRLFAFRLLPAGSSAGLSAERRP
jgi:hypothetical protein